ncbi:MAG TPA: hypothetical protein VFH92_13255, partial [Phenylobacterium sp.]|nr:hypothetical protein [Phenylobacterium sp.]
MSRFRIAALALAAAALTGARAQAGEAAGPHYISAAEIAARLAAQTGGSVNFALPTGPEATVLAARRDRPGEVELHKALADEFIAQSGHATVVVG